MEKGLRRGAVHYFFAIFRMALVETRKRTNATVSPSRVLASIRQFANYDPGVCSTSDKATRIGGTTDFATASPLVSPRPRPGPRLRQDVGAAKEDIGEKVKTGTGRCVASMLSVW